eukprot:NODE_594_length_1939_cov_12.698942_g475_i0.p1 GENE.NODE_594_length_1939_cov_12.698942_g475_i0~~NODE_594_length_1939_cov_12.698942_g475_i0.p1  ORF type:complete len:631 (-),score=149.58 NODE_594_length_1939_cov_12.698942_g475_i0:47-1840(-)
MWAIASNLTPGWAQSLPSLGQKTNFGQAGYVADLLGGFSAIYTEVYSISAINVALLWIRFFTFTHYNARLSVLSETLANAAHVLLSVCLFVLIILVAFSMAGTTLFGAHISGYRTFGKAAGTVLQMVSSGGVDSSDSRYGDVAEVNSLLGSIFYLSFMTFLQVILLNLVISVLGTAYGNVYAAMRPVSWSPSSIWEDIRSIIYFSKARLTKTVDEAPTPPPKKTKDRTANEDDSDPSEPDDDEGPGDLEVQDITDGDYRSMGVGSPRRTRIPQGPGQDTAARARQKKQAALWKRAALRSEKVSALFGAFAGIVTFDRPAPLTVGDNEHLLEAMKRESAVEKDEGAGVSLARIKRWAPSLSINQIEYVLKEAGFTFTGKAALAKQSQQLQNELREVTTVTNDLSVGLEDIHNLLGALEEAFLEQQDQIDEMADLFGGFKDRALPSLQTIDEILPLVSSMLSHLDLHFESIQDSNRDVERVVRNVGDELTHEIRLHDQKQDQMRAFDNMPSRSGGGAGMAESVDGLGSASSDAAQRVNSALSRIRARKEPGARPAAKSSRTPFRKKKAGATGQTPTARALALIAQAQMSEAAGDSGSLR